MTIAKACRAVGALVGLCIAAASTAADLEFHPHPDGGWSFDTGILRGRLHAAGRSLGLQDVTHVPTGTRLDRSNGLLSHYRVFTRGRRYGAGAWDWPATLLRYSHPDPLSSALDPTAIGYAWAETPERPFRLEAKYRIVDAATLELTTDVHASRDLAGFESFVASYFSERFDRCRIGIASPEGGAGTWLNASRERGEWQVYPRTPEVIPLIQDGRWAIAPNPVTWTVKEALGQTSLAVRQASATGLCGALISRPDDTFAISTPHETEGHYSVYFSLFGRDLKAGQTATGRIRLAVVADLGGAWTSQQAAVRAWRQEAGPTPKQTP